MNRYLFVFRKPDRTTIEIISTSLLDAEKKAFKVLGEENKFDLTLTFMTENFDCARCRPSVTECEYPGW
jgi:hypothetical protein